MFPSVVGCLEGVTVGAGPKDPRSTGFQEKTTVDCGWSLGKDRWEKQSEHLWSEV